MPLLSRWASPDPLTIHGGDNGIPLDRIPIGVRRVFGMVR
jgi:hypothetical protein